MGGQGAFSPLRRRVALTLGAVEKPRSLRDRRQTRMSVPLDFHRGTGIPACHAPEGRELFQRAPRPGFTQGCAQTEVRASLFSIAKEAQASARAPVMAELTQALTGGQGHNARGDYDPNVSRSLSMNDLSALGAWPPRDLESFSRSDFSSEDRLPGTQTIVWTKRSPEPKPRR